MPRYTVPAIIATAQKKDIEELRKLSKDREAVNLTDSDGRSALHQCALDGWEDGLQLLLDQGAELDLKDGIGKSALHYSAPLLSKTRIGHF